MKVVTAYKTTLSQNLTSTQTDIPVVSLETSDSTPHTIVAADFDSYAILVIEPGGSNQEIISVTGTDTTNIKWTGATRGLAFYGGTPTTVAGNRKTHQAGSTVIMSNAHWYYDTLMDLDSDETVTGVKTFANGATPIIIDAPVGATDAANKNYVDTHGSGPTYYDQNIVAGIAGENLTAGWAVYLKTSDGKWYGTQATISGTSEGILLGVAQATALSGASTTILIGGVDKNQSGLTPGALYYLSDTKGAISATPGTKSVVIGQCDTVATELVVSQRFTQVPTATEKAAMVGVSGTAPSTSNPFVDNLALLGIVVPYGGFTAPTGWLLCDGSAVSRTTYANLFNLLNPSQGTATMTIATPCVVTKTGHGLVAGDTVYFTTTGALPTGVTANTKYFVISAGLTADDFEISATFGGAAINTSGSQSGVHTLFRTPYGVGNGSTTFNVPSLKGNVPAGVNASDSNFKAVGQTGGESTHTLTVAEIPAHHHTVDTAESNGSSVAFSGTAGVPHTFNTQDTGGDGAHNNLQPYIALNYIIKT